jgi:hypothetical protein
MTSKTRRPMKPMTGTKAPAKKAAARSAKEMPEAVVVTGEGTALPPVVLEQVKMKRGVAVEGENVSVSSSNIKTVKWERLLTVEFHNGARYIYLGVPVEVWRGLMEAASHGKFLAEAGMTRYPHRKV